MPKPSTVTVTYTGGQDQVTVLFPSGDFRRVDRGASIDVLPGDAASLSPDEWETSDTPTSIPAAEADKK